MGNSEKTNRKQNHGFSLITVIVSVSFVGILGMLVLYIAMSNFNMKMTDMKGKDSFYTAERALEEISAGLQQDVGEAMSEAYTQVLENYNINKDDIPDGVSEASRRQTRFQILYLQLLTKRLSYQNNTNQYDLEYLKKYLDHKEGEGETLLVVNPEGKKPVMKSDNTGVLLKNIKVIHVDQKGRASVICTDIRLGIPSANFPAATTHAELTSMSVIADSGIECSATTQTKIDGNVYAGRMSETDYSSVNIKSGASLSLNSVDKFVSEGEIDVAPQGTLDVAVGVKLWAKGVSLSSATVYLRGITYLSDDLTVERGTGSTVTLSGDYYGYGSLASAKADECLNKEYYANFKDADLSSAIVINGKNTTMNLSDLNRLMVSGRSYIASSKANPIQGKTNTDVITGESITVKGTQLAYLVPSQLLGTDTSLDAVSDGTSSEGTTEAQAVLTNPMTFAQYTTYLVNNNVSEIPVKKDCAVATWGNKTLLQIGVDEKEPVKCVFYNDNTAGDRGYVYFYLNFTDDIKAAEFMNTYYYPSVKGKMDEYLSFYFGKDSFIKMRDSSAYMRFVTNGNILSYKGASGEGDIQEPTVAFNDDMLKSEQIKLQNTWYALNRKMVENVTLLETDVKHNGIHHHNEADSNRSVFDNMINEEMITEKIPAGTYREFTTEDGLLCAVIRNNPTEPYVIDDSKVSKLRLVVCTGDVIVKNAAFKGVILTKGKLTFEGTSASLETAPIDVSMAYQAVDVSDGLMPGSFFWDGTENVPSGTENDDTADDSEETTGATDGIFDLSDCVSYENWKKQ